MSNLPNDLSNLDVELTDSTTDRSLPPFAELHPESTSAARSAGASVSPGLVATLEEDPVENHHRRMRRRLAWVAIPSWLISFFLHLALIIFMAAMTLDPKVMNLSMYTASEANPSTEVQDDSFDLDKSTTLSLDESSADEVPEQVATELPPDIVKEIEVETNLDVAIQMELPNMVAKLAPSEILSARASASQGSLNARSDSKMRSELLERFGGNSKSEEAVRNALQWLATHQLPDGSWSFFHTARCRGQCGNPGSQQNRNASTGLALMTFLGAGQTHTQGTYQSVVREGLAYLIKSMKLERNEIPTGSWFGGQRPFDDTMYGHGIATIAFCEAYAMTGDPALAEPAQLAINFIVYAQNPVLGGWQYAPREGSDTSVVGWQIMALKSGSAGGLVIPLITLQKADMFLTNVSMNDGAYYGYNEPTSEIEGRRATTAVGLLCRMYMGWKKNHPALKEGVDFLAARGPSPVDMYYNYYATQVLKQYGGPQWDAWNEKIRDQLIDSQEKEGHARGSWFVEDRGPGDGAAVGGRLYITCMAAMILEVYYRYMPLYGDQTDEDSFNL